MPQPVLYTWNFSASRLAALRSLCGGLGIRLRPVSPAECGLPLGKLPDPPRPAGPSAMPFPEEMLLMAFFPDRLTDALLAGLREKGLAPIRRKAVLTPFNALWDSKRLYRELTEEAERMGAGPSAHGQRQEEDRDG